MSNSKVPTISFVLPLYHKMEKHLEAVASFMESSFNIRNAAECGLEKLKKHSGPAKTHHSYVIGTILHPCLRSHWFATTSESDDERGAQQAIRKAGVIFKFVAESYLETQPEFPLVPAIPELVSKPVTKTPSFLASACSFQRPAVAMTATISKWTPREALDDELTRYFNFEAAPGDQGCERSAEDILLNPLLWWKVHAVKFPVIAQMARDYLAIPATSVAVERVFSKSRHICGNLRSSLKERTITMALLTKTEWVI